MTNLVFIRGNKMDIQKQIHGYKQSFYKYDIFYRENNAIKQNKKYWFKLFYVCLYGWEHLSKHKNLSEDFIRKYQDKVDWEYISEYQTLSEYFIHKFKDKVDWYKISEYQILSEEFIREFKDNFKRYR